MTIPYVIELTGRGERCVDIYKNSTPHCQEVLFFY